MFLQGGAGSSALDEQVTKNMCHSTGLLNQSTNACPHVNNKLKVINQSNQLLQGQCFHWVAGNKLF